MKLLRTDKTTGQIDKMPAGDGNAIIARFAQLNGIAVVSVEQMLNSGERLENRFYQYRKDNR